jgi:hypothetical protein
MAQGKAGSTVYEPKNQPNARAVNPGAVADIGIRQIRTKSVELYAGRGIEAPKPVSTYHRSGSQGKR